MSRRFPSATLTKIKNLLGEIPAIKLAYLYGSALSKKDFRDIDIALGLKPPVPARFDSIGFRIKIASALSKSVTARKEFDVHLLHEMPLALQYRVISTGRCILCRKDLDRVRYETRVLNEFLDFKPTHDWLVERTLERTSRL